MPMPVLDSTDPDQVGRWETDGGRTRDSVR
jgi:hypothetical protein